MRDGGCELEADVEGEGGGVAGDVVQLVVVPRHAHAQPGHAPRAAATGGLLASHRGQHLHVTLHTVLCLTSYIQAYRAIQNMFHSLIPGNSLHGIFYLFYPFVIVLILSLFPLN